MARGKLLSSGKRVGVYLDEQWRENIEAGKLLKRLRDHAQGNCEMKSTQIKAAEILLRKVLPDLAAVQMTATVEHRTVAELPTDELVRIAGIAAPVGGAGTVAPAGGDPQPPSVH